MRKKCLLIVDPDRLIVDSLVENLERRGLLVLGVMSTENARHHLQKLSPDAVIVDAHMLAAPDFIRHVRTDLPDAKLVVLTRRPHALGNGNLLVLDRNHGLQYLTTALGSIVADSDAPGCPILVANNRESSKSHLKELIEQWGHPVYTVSLGREVQEFMTEVPEIPIAMIDVELNDEGGLDCLKRIVGREVHPETIVTSRFPDAEIGAHALNLGGFDYIYEPFEPSVLHGSLAAALAHREFRCEQSLWGRLLPRFVKGRASKAS